MVRTVGVVDEQPYPGPPDGAEFLDWSNPFADVTEAIRSFGAAMEPAWWRMREVYEENMRGIAEYITVMDELDPVVHTVVPPRVPKHVGPRTGPTFDRRGRRRF